MNHTRPTRRRDDGVRALRTDLAVAPPAGTQITFRTATGSRYEINLATTIWRRTRTLASGRLPKDEGPIIGLAVGWPGQAAFLFLPPLDDGLGPRQLRTSLVVGCGADGGGESSDD